MPFRLVDSSAVNEVIASSQNSTRRRAFLPFHDSSETVVQRLLKVIQPASYIRPHKHERSKVEIYSVIQGKLVLVAFADDGRIAEHVVLEAGKSPWFVEVPDFWHTAVSLESDTVVYEIIEGPWQPANYKEFPAWSPAEEEVEKGQAFIARIREELMLY